MQSEGDSAVGLDEPTVLLVAAGERLAPALKARLGERGLFVELALPENAARAAFVAAPDLVVLAGRAAEAGGVEVLTALAERPVTATLPVVLIDDLRSARDSAFRHGVVAVIERSASADEMARRIAELARELPERSGETAGGLGEGTVDELVELFGGSVRSGILSVRAPDGSSAQVVLRADRPVTETIAELVERIRPLVQRGDVGPLSYEFQESAPSRISSLDLDTEIGDDEPAEALADRRVLLVAQNPARADLLAQRLRAAGATVAVADGTGHGLELARDLGPEVVLLDGSGAESWAADALRVIRRDPRLRWASLLVVETERLWANPRSPDLAIVAPRVRALVAPDAELAQRVRARPSVLTRLDVVGPVRMLRALAGTGLDLRVRVAHPRARVELDLAEGLVAGAAVYVQGQAAPVAEGPSALSTLLGLSSGRVQISHEEAPRSANVMAPVDDAIAVAAAEQPVVAPSMPPPSIAPPMPAGAVADARPGELPGLVRRLEALLGVLEDVATEDDAPAPAAASATPPSEFPSIGDDDDAEATGHYDPDLVERLRARMRRRSSQSMRPVAEVDDEAADDGASGDAPRDAPVGAPPRAATSADAPSAAPVDAPAEPSPEAPRPAVPPPPGALFARTATSKAPAPTPSGGVSRRRVARRHRTLVLGSAAASADVTEPAELDTAAVDESAEPRSDEPSSGVRDSVGAAPQAPARNRPMIPSAALPPPPPKPLRAMPRAADGGAAPVPPPPPAAVQESPVAPAASRDASIDLPPSPALPPTPAREREGEGAGDAMFDVGGSGAGRLDAPELTVPRRRWIVPVVAVGALLLVGGGAVAAVAMLGDDDPPATTAVLPADEQAPSDPASLGPNAEGEAPPDRATEPATEPPASDEAAALADEAVPDPDAPASLPSAASPSLIGPAPGDPIEGTEASFDLARFGIEPAEPPDSRRRRVLMVRELMREGNRARNDGRLDEAERAYHEVLAAFPDNARATAGMTRVHMERGQHAPAVAFAQRLVRLRPRYASNYVLLGDTLREADNDAAARRAYERAVELEPRWAPARQRLEELDAAP